MASRASGSGAGWGWMMASGVLSVVLGFLALIWPFPATFAATLIVGSLFLALGVFAIVAGAAGRGHERRGFLIAYGALSVIGGLLLLFFPVHGALTLTVFVTAWLAVRGVMEIVAGTRVTRHRGMLIVLGIINVLLAVMIYTSLPWAALTLPGYMLGVSFILGGASEIAAASAHRGPRVAAA